MDKSASDQTNSGSEESYPHEKRNLVVFALNQILMRLGWDVQIRVCGHSSVY